MTPIALEQPPGRMFDNIIHFARALRKAGARIGPAQTLDAMRAAQATRLASKADLYWSLRACLARRPEEIEIFDRLFAMFWRNPELGKDSDGGFQPGNAGAGNRQAQIRRAPRPRGDAGWQAPCPARAFRRKARKSASTPVSHGRPAKSLHADGFRTDEP